VYFSEYVINQGMAPVLYYRDELFGMNCSDQMGLQYRIYQLVYQSGVFVSRSSVNFVRVKRLWIPAVSQVVNAIFLFLVAVYEFVPAIWFIFLIIFWEGKTNIDQKEQKERK
jgi:battenin